MSERKTADEILATICAELDEFSGTAEETQQLLRDITEDLDHRWNDVAETVAQQHAQTPSSTNVLNVLSTERVHWTAN